MNTRYTNPKPALAGVPAPSPEEGTVSKQSFPPGWDESRVRDVLTHYENQTEDDQAAEVEAALVADKVTMIAVPVELADEVRALIARKRSA